MRLFLSLLLLITINISASAQTGSLFGQVIFSKNKPVAQATLSIKSIQKMAITDSEGRFKLEELPYGKYTLEITSLEAEHKKVEFILQENAQQLNITVKEKEHKNLNDVTILGQSDKKIIETKGFAVNVIEMDKVALQSIQTNELLDRSAGVRIRQDGGLGSHIHYNINGLSGNAVKTFIDGVPASNYGPSFSLNSIPTALIERIEVYKGVVPASLSDDALGGAINIILKQKTRNSLLTSYSIGSFNTHQWNIAGNLRKQNGFTLDASAFNNYSDNSYEVWGPSIAFKDYSGATKPNQRVKRFHDAYQSYGARFNTGFTNVKWADRFLIGGVFSKDYKEIQHGITMDNVYGDRHTRGNSNIATLSYNKKNIFLEGLSLRVDASYSYIKRQAIDTVGVMYDWSGQPLKFPDGTFVKYNSGAEIASAKTLGINSDKTLMAKIGIDYKITPNNTIYVNYLYNNFIRGITDELQPAVIQRLTNTRDLQKNIVSFTFENLAFEQKLRTNIFYKHYFQTMTTNEPLREDQVPGVPFYKLNTIVKNVDYSGYGIAFSYKLFPNLYVLASGEKAIRIPTANELFGNVNDNILAPAGTLNPETSYNANLGLNFGTYTFNQHAIKLNASVFYRNTQGMIRESIRAGSFTFSQFENLENVLSKGIDAELNYNYANKIDFTFNISKFDALFNTAFNSNGAPYLFYRTQIRNEPSFKFNSNLSYYFKDLFLKGARGSVYYNINYVKGFLRNWANVGGKNLDYIPTQFSNDLGMAYTLPSNKITIGLDGKNIFDQQIFDNFGLQKPGRAFYLKLTYSIL